MGASVSLRKYKSTALKCSAERDGEPMTHERHQKYRSSQMFSEDCAHEQAVSAAPTFLMNGAHKNSKHLGGSAFPSLVGGRLIASSDRDIASAQVQRLPEGDQQDGVHGFCRDRHRNGKNQNCAEQRRTEATKNCDKSASSAAVSCLDEVNGTAAWPPRFRHSYSIDSSLSSSEDEDPYLRPIMAISRRGTRNFFSVELRSDGSGHERLDNQRDHALPLYAGRADRIYRRASTSRTKQGEGRQSQFDAVKNKPALRVEISSDSSSDEDQRQQWLSAVRSPEEYDLATMTARQNGENNFIKPMLRLHHIERGEKAEKTAVGEINKSATETPIIAEFVSLNFSSSDCDEDYINGLECEEVYDWLDTAEAAKNENGTHPSELMGSHLEECDGSVDDSSEVGEGDNVYNWLETSFSYGREKIKKGEIKDDNKLKAVGICVCDEEDDTDEFEEEEPYNWLELGTSSGLVDRGNKERPRVKGTKPNRIQLPGVQLPGVKTPLDVQKGNLKYAAFLTPNQNEVYHLDNLFTPPTPDSPLAREAWSLGFQRKVSVRIVKDTTKVMRKKVALPSKKPDAIKGDWLTNRYIVNNYIILNPLGKGSYAEVRLCKEKNNNQLYAVKIMNKGILERKVVSCGWTFL